MIVADVFKVYLYADPIAALDDVNYPFVEGENITSGILNVDIQFGTDIYEGPQQQIDTGQFTIVTRNPAMDPKINPNLKYNSAIKFVDTRITNFGETNEFFRGYVTDIQVEYQRKDDPIITITGTDIFGAMQRVVVDQDTHDSIMALSTGLTWNGLTFTEFLPYMNDFTSKYLDLEAFQNPGAPLNYGFWFPTTGSFGSQSVGFLDYSPAKYIPQVGETYLDVINKYGQTNMTLFSARGEFGYDYINVSSFPKWNPNYWAPQQDPMLEYQTYDFSSEPVDGRPYQSILLNNGYNRVINQTDISNEYRYVDTGELKSVSENFTRISSTSIEDYAISRASISTIFPEDATRDITDWVDGYSRDIFQVTQYPDQEIQQITFDNARLEDVENDFTYSNYNLNRMVRIKHEVSDTEIIDRVYDIAGISHNISPDNWEMNFTLKPSAQEIVFNYQGSLPTLDMNATSGDSNFNFTATLIDYDPATVEEVVWALSATDSNEIAQMWPYVAFGNMFKNGVPKTGLTQTWNFDDDGILEPYSFDPDSTFENPLDNRYGGYGVGNWTVYAYLILTNGFIAVLQQDLVVGTPEVTANFGWTQNLINNFGQVQFTDTSVNNETGEVNSYAWDFGDGTTSSERNPVHQYSPAPDETEYEVSLTVFAYGEGGVEVPNTHTETVTLEQPVMVPDFTHTQIQQTITFTNTSTNVGFEEADAYFWDFGDGTTSTLKNPVKTYGVSQDVETSFSVTLTTRNIWEQTESETKTVTIEAINSSGTFGISFIKFKINAYTPPGTVGAFTHRVLTPVMQFFKGVTSGTGENLTYLKPFYGFNDNYLPHLLWYSNYGQSVQENLGWDYFLTRNPQGLDSKTYGDGALAERVRPVRWELVVQIGTPVYTINDVILTFEDFFERDAGPNYGINTEDFYARINVEVANTIGGFTPNPVGTYGPPSLNGNWVNIGYFKVDGGRMDPTKPAGERTQTTKTMFKMRPMPLNIPYFNYTFNDKIVSFTSVETADSYAWDFGDGTTSTDKDPVKTYASYNTYTVTLEVTNDAVVTRTTTEPVIVQAPVI
jgi:PKD repeat protein